MATVAETSINLLNCIKVHVYCWKTNKLKVTVIVLGSGPKCIKSISPLEKVPSNLALGMILSFPICRYVTAVEGWERIRL